ncbi:MAG TPA: TadE family protein [Candidatus Dormibacteraeota bacterium]|jgi:Flp pilus assembly protein TadG|nr:TadE family protein [Candidatus Dormibacteraeota bacterium]
MTPTPSASARGSVVSGRDRRRLRRRARGRQSGVGMVEFSLVAPFAFFLFCTVVVLGIVITNLIQLTNVARDGARIAAICGSVKGTQMPDGSGDCTGLAISTYITTHLVSIPAGSVSPKIYVCSPEDASTCSSSTTSCSTSDSICRCQSGKIVEVDMAYDQPLYVPLVSSVLQTNPNGTRHITASAQATCEQ